MDGVALFNKTSLECSKLITQNYSTSFTLGIKLLDEKYHNPIYGIYGFVRYADEIVDTFLKSDRKKFFHNFKRDTYEAIDNRLSFNPVLHAFQLIVNEYNIEKKLIEAFLHSMEMDLSFYKYDNGEYREYIYGSGEVIGLMCLRVFCEGDDALYTKLYKPACKLGSAFQKINFLRDIKSDYEERGRVYFPGVDYKKFDKVSKEMIEKDIQADLDEAAIGIAQLPEEAKSGVQTAYFLYKKLFEKIKTLPPETIVQQRVRVSKFVIMMSEKFFYFWLNIFIISIPFIASFESRLNYFSKWRALFPAILLTATFFIPWDVSFNNNKIWRFNSRYCIGIKMFGIPLEEVMFFFTVPYSCVFIHESLKYFFPQDIFHSIAKPVFYLANCIFAVTGVYNCNKKYTCINSFIALGIMIIHYCIFGDQLLGRYMFSFIIHLIPFFICNGILTGGCGMEEPIVIYNESEKINFRIGTIPVEDIIYSSSLLLMNITLFEWFQDYYAQIT